MEQVVTDAPAMDSWQRERLLKALEGFRNGVAEAPLLRKWSETGRGMASTSRADFTRRASKAGQLDPMPFVLSTDEVDRHGDVIATDGWKLESYRKNPVFLWAHDYARPVIGRVSETWLEPHRLLARVEFAPTAFAQEVAALYLAGYQKGVSVGFKPLKFEERRSEKTGALLGIRFLEQELLEVSAVPVPANRNALRRALNEAPLSAEYLRRSADVPGLSKSGAHLSAPGGPAESALEAMWGVISARIDDLAKLTEELASDAAEVEKTAFGEGGDSPGDAGVLEILAALREAHK